MAQVSSFDRVPHPGKTAAFLIPILEGIDASKNSVQAIIMTNTRELVLQIAAEAKKLAAHMKGVQIMSTIGGMTYREDIVRLRGTVHILVGTPGRVVDMLVDKRVSSLKDCKVLALDEADKMLEDNFLEDTERVIDELPADRQLMLFSATYPASVKEFRDRHMPAEHRHDANLMEELTLKGVTQYYAFVDERQKVQCLQTLFSRIQVNQCMIFCASAKRVALLSRKITELGFSCLFIHAHMDQADRNRVFHDFREGAVRNLVCTDVFARGIDNQAVNVVINFDFPGAPQTYLNRIGRSGRYGHRGVAISFISEADKYNMYVIERELNTTISVIPDEIPAELYATDTSVEAEGF